MEWNNPKIAIVSGLFLMGAIIAYLIIPMSQENTIILTTPSGTVNSCANPNLVLAQNLTDLCDVTIVSPSTNQILQYNGSQWINVAQVTFNDTTSCNNLGDGVILCRDGNVNMKTLEPLEGIAITNDSEKVYIANNGVLSVSNGTGIECDTVGGDVTCSNTAPESTVCTNLGTVGEGLYVSGNCNFKKLLAGSGVTLTANGTRITIATTTASESTVCSGQSGNYNIVASSSGGNCTFKNLVGGTGMSLSSNSTHITLTNTKPEQGCSSAGGTSIWKTTTTCDAKGLLAGLGLTLTSNTNDNTFKTNFVNGTGIRITGTGAQTFTNTYDCSSAGGTTLIKTATAGSSCVLKGLTAGTGISVTSNTNDNAIANTGVTSLSSADTSSLSFDASTGAITATPVLKKLCEVVASGGESTLTCTLSSSQQYLWVRGAASYNTDTTTIVRMRFNADSGNNYSYRNELNGGADATTTSTSGFSIASNTANQLNHINFQCSDFVSSAEKFCTGFRTFSSSGAGSAPAKSVWAAKWANTANDITSVSFAITAGTGTFEANNFLTVWGYS